jgi:hypothetical protein
LNLSSEHYLWIERRSDYDSSDRVFHFVVVCERELLFQNTYRNRWPFIGFPLSEPCKARRGMKCRCFSTAILILLLAAIPLFGIRMGSAATRTQSSPVSQSARSLAADSFDFKTEIFGKISSITVQVVSIDTGTGEVTLNGVDTRRPTVPFTWDWDDGKVTVGWFPQSHTYVDTRRNYIAKVTSHYSGGETGSAEALVGFIGPTVTPTHLSPDVAVSIPNNPVNLMSRMPGYHAPGLGYFSDAFFPVTRRAIVEYVLTAAASIQKDFANDNVYLVDGGFRQVVLRDSQFEGMYSLWYTSPVALAAGDSMWQGSIPYSSIFHEMGHDVTLNSPSNYFYGGKIDGNANAIFSESMAQIFQHATACELVNNAGTYGLSDDIVFEIKQSAIQSMWIVRDSYQNYVSSGMDFSSWNDPATPTDETFGTFMTIAYRFFVHAENSGLGYRVPLKKMMTLLQEFRETDKTRYSQYSNTQTAETFRATLMVAALSYGFGEDLRTEFRDLKFPISDEIYNEQIQRASTSTPSQSTTTAGTAQTSTVISTTTMPTTSSPTGSVTIGMPTTTIAQIPSGRPASFLDILQQNSLILIGVLVIALVALAVLLLRRHEPAHPLSA